MYRKSRKSHTKSYRKTMKKMNCNPSVSGKTVNHNSCYTSSALLKIKNSYNKNHPNDKIKSLSTKKIFEDLRNKLAYCEKENCWLEQLSNTDRKYLDKNMFAPQQPIEWKNNPREWLSNIDILQVLEQYENKYENFKFIGPTPIDFDTQLPEGKCVWKDLCTLKLKKMIDTGIDKIGIIFNLDKHNESGSHWVSMFIDIKENFIFYFDSAANEIPKEINTLVQKVLHQCKALNILMKYYTNCPKQHQQGNTECGMYSLYFIITMLENEKKQTINLFKNKIITDKFVESFRLKYFNN